MEKAYLSRISELEKKLLEAKSEAEKREILSQLQEVRSRLESMEKERAKPVSPEGWQSDEARLVAELGTRFLEIIRERKPIEHLVRIVPKTEEKREKTEKSLADLIREAGGEVEE
jgi:ribosome-binding ATPase YchF (GTP1/OBG family)